MYLEIVMDSNHCYDPPMLYCNVLHIYAKLLGVIQSPKNGPNFQINH